MELTEAFGLAAAAFSGITSVVSLITRADMANLKTEMLNELRRTEKELDQKFVRRTEFESLQHRMEAPERRR